MNKECRLIEQEEYEKLIKTLIEGGWEYDGVVHKSNKRLAAVLICETNLGCRISDILRLTLNSFVKVQGRVLINIIEKKTKKKRQFSCSHEFYNFILNYCMENGITNKDQRIFQLTDRGVQKYLKEVCDYLGYEGIGTHSFRKKGATDLYNRSGFNAALVSLWLQHNSVSTSLKYIKMSEGQLETLLQENTNIPI